MTANVLRATLRTIRDSERRHLPARPNDMSENHL